MWLVIGTALVAYAWYVSFLFAPLHLFVVGTLMYAIYYVAAPDHRDWPWLRRQAAWDWVRRGWFHHSWHQRSGWKSLAPDTRSRPVPFLFVVHPQCYGMATAVAFGSHGRRCRPMARISPVVMMPRLLMRVPVLTDLLQYLGCVDHCTERLPDYLNQNRSVVWSPVGGGSMTSDDILSEEPVAPGELLDDHFFGWLAGLAARSPFQLVAVCHAGERDLYWNASPWLPRRLRQFQRDMHLKWGCDWPLPVFGWWGTCVPRPRELRTSVGQPIAAAGMSGPALREAFCREYNQLAAHETEMSELVIVH